ncbi:MAG: molecular chaperone HtpG [Bacillota bacterium]|jgi:molecular chaperone HtpG|nr:molecular chaperone HtpG [Bacillota bacterium]
MVKKQFKTESKRLLDLMINSIYTNREIFLRELISNASDALDKRYYLSLTDETKKVDKELLKIFIEKDEEARTLTIKDTGIGMTKNELEENLGTIARSGSLEFKQELDKADANIDIIGQFGVGFYSAFMVAKKVEVISRSIDDEKGYIWESSGEDGYTITKYDTDEIGTKIILHLKDDTNDDNYSSFLDSYKIEELIKKYSDYVRYPIEMMVTTSKLKEGSDSEYEDVEELKVLNSMVPLWKKNKNEITKEEYSEFYKSTFNDWEDPLDEIHYSLEGNISYTALLYIPSKKPFNFYNSDYEAGLRLYSSGVFIMDKANDLIPDYFRFVKGIVDSDDLSLNISREILQQDRQVKLLANSIQRRIKTHLENMIENDRESYEKLFDNFGLNLKYGIYQDFGAHIDTLKDLILFKSSKEDKYVSLKEYVERKPEEQKVIYYVTGDSIEDIKKSPQMEKLIEKEIEVLYFMEDVDEFAITMMRAYNDIEFKSVNKGDFDLESEEEKKVIEEKTKENKSLLDAMKDSLTNYVTDVRVSSRLVNNPVCLVSDDGLSIEMEKVLSQSPNNMGMKANKILEINPNHEIFETLVNVYESDPELIKEYAKVLYDQALLIEGLPIENPIDYSNKVIDLMIKAVK